MNSAPVTPEACFADIIEEFLEDPAVTSPANTKQSKNTFGSSGLKVHNKIFAMLVKDRLVIKLPKSRVNALIASGKGMRFDPRHDGRLMKEWITIELTSGENWISLAKEAMKFVSSK
jgi:TfoX/Sxy family transcriptional regulator of competence genes